MGHSPGRCGVCKVAEPLGLRHVVVPGNSRSPRGPQGGMALEERFWQKVAGPWCEGVEEEDCWLWLGATGGEDYGRVWGGERFGYAGPHRLALLLLDAQDHLVPPDRSLVDACHSCDTPLCCNPRHLRWGTRQENVADQGERGRAWWQRSKRMGSRRAYSEYLERERLEAEAAAIQAALA